MFGNISCSIDLWLSECFFFTKWHLEAWWTGINQSKLTCDDIQWFQWLQVVIHHRYVTLVFVDIDGSVHKLLWYNLYIYLCLEYWPMTHPTWADWCGARNTSSHSHQQTIWVIFIIFPPASPCPVATIWP